MRRMFISLEELYKLHLPAELEIFLAEHHFFNGKKQYFLLNDQFFQISVSPLLFGDKTILPNAVSIKTLIKLNNGNQLEEQAIFINKVWHHFSTALTTSDTISSTIYGNKEYCLKNGLTHEECLEQTPDIINTLVVSITALIKFAKQINLSQHLASAKNKSCSLS